MDKPSTRKMTRRPATKRSMVLYVLLTPLSMILAQKNKDKDTNKKRTTLITQRTSTPEPLGRGHRIKRPTARRSAAVQDQDLGDDLVLDSVKEEAEEEEEGGLLPNLAQSDSDYHSDASSNLSLLSMPKDTTYHPSTTKKSSRSSKGRGDPNTPRIWCHQCHQDRSSERTHPCSSCLKSYCAPCLHRRYKLTVAQGTQAASGWVCPRCSNFCDCHKCVTTRGQTGTSAIPSINFRKDGRGSASAKTRRQPNAGVDLAEDKASKGAEYQNPNLDPPSPSFDATQSRSTTHAQLPPPSSTPPSPSVLPSRSRHPSSSLHKPPSQEEIIFDFDTPLTPSSSRQHTVTPHSPIKQEDLFSWNLSMGHSSRSVSTASHSSSSSSAQTIPHPTTPPMFPLTAMNTFSYLPMTTTFEEPSEEDTHKALIQTSLKLSGVVDERGYSHLMPTSVSPIELSSSSVATASVFLQQQHHHHSHSEPQSGMYNHACSPRSLSISTLVPQPHSSSSSSSQPHSHHQSYALPSHRPTASYNTNSLDPTLFPTSSFSSSPFPPAPLGLYESPLQRSLPHSHSHSHSHLTAGGADDGMAIAIQTKWGLHNSALEGVETYDSVVLGGVDSQDQGQGVHGYEDRVGVGVDDGEEQERRRCMALAAEENEREIANSMAQFLNVDIF